MRSLMGALGDLADSFPHAALTSYFRNDCVTKLVHAAEGKRNTRTRGNYFVSFSPKIL